MPTLQELFLQAANDLAANYHREHGDQAIQVLVGQIEENQMSKPSDLKFALQVIARLDRMIRNQ